MQLPSLTCNTSPTADAHPEVADQPTLGYLQLASADRMPDYHPELLKHSLMWGMSINVEILRYQCFVIFFHRQI